MGWCDVETQVIQSINTIIIWGQIWKKQCQIIKLKVRIIIVLKRKNRTINVHFQKVHRTPCLLNAQVGLRVLNFMLQVNATTINADSTDCWTLPGLLAADLLLKVSTSFGSSSAVFWDMFLVGGCGCVCCSPSLSHHVGPSYRARAVLLELHGSPKRWLHEWMRFYLFLWWALHDQLLSVSLLNKIFYLHL